MTATDVTGFDAIFSTGFFAIFSRFSGARLTKLHINTGETAKNPVESLQWRRRPEIADFCPLSWSNLSRDLVRRSLAPEAMQEADWLKKTWRWSGRHWNLVAFPEGPARQIDVSRQKLTPHCLEAIFDSQLPSPKLSPKRPPKLSLPHKRGLFILFQN